MKKIVLTFGLVSGLVLSAIMMATLPFHDRMGNGVAMFVGYASMVAASVLVFFGVRRYRDDIAGGTTTFGRAFAVGMLIVVVSSLCYVLTWETYYYGFSDRDYLVRYQAKELERDRAKGLTPAELERKRAEGERFAKLYENPAVNSALTFVEPLPVGLLAALLSAALLRRRRVDARGAEIGGVRAT